MPFIPAIVGVAVDAGVTAAAGDAVATAATVGGEAASAAGVGGEAAATAASVGGEAASLGEEAARVGGEAASVGEDAASVGGDVGSIADKGANALFRGLGQLAKNDGQRAFVRGLEDGHKIAGKLNDVQDKINKLQNIIGQPGGANNNGGSQGPIDLTDALEGLRNLQQQVETLQGQLAKVDGPEGYPAAAHNPSIVLHLPESAGHGLAELGDLHEGVEESPFPLERGAGSANLRI
jgi:hypothetical protein